MPSQGIWGTGWGRKPKAKRLRWPEEPRVVVRAKWQPERSPSPRQGCILLT